MVRSKAKKVGMSWKKRTVKRCSSTSTRSKSVKKSLRSKSQKSRRVKKNLGRKRGLNRRKKSMRSKKRRGRRNMRGGNANTLPIEYFGGNSGRYSENPNDGGTHEAYGDYVGQSFGMPLSQDMSGPNLFVNPVSPSGSMTDGF